MPVVAECRVYAECGVSAAQEPLAAITDDENDADDACR